MPEVKIYNSINKIEKSSWNALVENNIYMCYEWLKTIEDTTLLTLHPYYIVVYDKGKVAAISVCCFENRNTNYRTIDNLLYGRLINFLPQKYFSFFPAVICTPYRGYGTHFAFSKELEFEHVMELQEILLETIEKIASKQKASVCFSNVMEHETHLIELLVKRGYLKSLSLPLNYMDVKWSSFNDYKNYVSKKHPASKKMIPYEINKSRKNGVVINQLQYLDEHHKRRFYELLKMNYQKYNGNSFPVKSDYFQKLKDNFGDNAILFTATKGDNIIGVSVEVKKDSEAVLAYIGIDHKVSKQDLTYFNIGYYEPIKKAPEHGIRKIYCGNALYEMKSRRGCNAATTFIFYKPNSGLWNHLVKVWFYIHYRWMLHKFSFIKE